MKKVIIIIVCVLSFLSCNNHCKEDTEFKETYFNMLDTIASYGRQFDTDEEVVFTLDKCSRFSNYADYLEFLTGHQFHYTIIELPIYQNQSDLQTDIRGLKKWYKANKCGMTREAADSIVNARYEEVIGKK